MQVAILGAGPAGMTCANALLTFGIDAIVLERDTLPGGAQRTNFHPNLWLLGAPEETGREVTERMVRHFRSLPIPLYLNTNIEHVTRPDARFCITFDSPGSDPSSASKKHYLEADALVLATGMRPRATPELLALAQTSPRLIIGPLSDAIRDDIRNAHVLILGGGDNALDHALYLAERGNRVSVRTRGQFSARPGFIDACANSTLIDSRTSWSPGQISADTGAIRVEGHPHEERFDWLLVMYGYQPNTEMLAQFEPALHPILTANGHIQTDAGQRTSVSGLYAAGDLTESIQPSVATAIAQGLVAARAIEWLGRTSA
jgi:thioredoxin reductase (NADPH)